MFPPERRTKKCESHKSHQLEVANRKTNPIEALSIVSLISISRLWSVFFQCHLITGISSSAVMKKICGPRLSTLLLISKTELLSRQNVRQVRCAKSFCTGSRYLTKTGVFGGSYPSWPWPKNEISTLYVTRRRENFLLRGSGTASRRLD